MTTAFNLKAAVAAGIKSGAKCDRCHDEHAANVSLHDWRMEWFAQTKPVAKLAKPVVKDEDK